MEKPIRAVGTLAPVGKQLVALAAFQKGTDFVAAASLLYQRRGSCDVFLHLLCQGLECISKALLLLRDFDANKPQLRPRFGHNLVKVSVALQSAYGLRPLRPPLMAELKTLNDYYFQHLLRYGEIHDIFGGTKELQYERVLSRAVALSAFGRRCFQNALPPPYGNLRRIVNN